jgi:chromosome partitioning protein
MRSIALMNQKGGVGKTTTAVNLSAGLAQAGERVLLVDLDPQAHASLHLGVELSSGQPSVYDVLVHGAPPRELLRTVAPRLALLPAHVDLVAAELDLAGRPDRESQLARALAPLAAEIDYLMIDCGPSLGLLVVNALAAAHEVVIPLQPHYLALQGLGKLLETVAMVRAAVNPALRVGGVVFCMHERGTRLAQEVHHDVHDFLCSADPNSAWHAARLFETCIRRNVKLAEAPSFGRTIFDYAPGSHGAEDYAALAGELRACVTSRAAALEAVAPQPVGDPPADATPVALATQTGG